MSSVHCEYWAVLKSITSDTLPPLITLEVITKDGSEGLDFKAELTFQVFFNLHNLPDQMCQRFGAHFFHDP